MRLQDKVCLITGGAAGIGRATAAKFAAEGARVVIGDVNEELGQQTAAEIGSTAEIGSAAEIGADVRFFQVNVADCASVQAWITAVVAAYGRIDVLVNNAGITRDAQLVKFKNGELVDQMSAAAWDAVIDVNLKGVFNCTQAVVPTMIAQGGGVVLNASSVVGLYGNFGQTNYVATKAGVIGMTKVWARELGKYGIRVNAVAPGFIATEMVRAMPDKVLATMQEHTPIGRLGEPLDIANAYAFLASAEASFITGAVLSVDGGIVIGT